MEDLAIIISKYESIELLAAEIRAGVDEGIESIEELTEYLENELEYANE